MCIHASLTFVYHDNRIGRSVTMLADDEYAEMVTPNLGFLLLSIAYFLRYIFEQMIVFV